MCFQVNCDHACSFKVKTLLLHDVERFSSRFKKVTLKINRKLVAIATAIFFAKFILRHTFPLKKEMDSGANTGSWCSSNDEMCQNVMKKEIIKLT